MKIMVSALLLTALCLPVTTSAQGRPAPDALQVAKDALKTGDFNGDGVIDRDEFARLNLDKMRKNNPSVQDQDHIAMIEAAFMQFDSNGDGKITLEEMEAFIARQNGSSRKAN